jgi:hypothetical protein
MIKEVILHKKINLAALAIFVLSLIFFSNVDNSQAIDKNNMHDADFIEKYGHTVEINPGDQEKIKVTNKDQTGKVLKVTNAKKWNDELHDIENEVNIYYGSEKNKEKYEKGEFLNKPDKIKS